MKLIISPSGYSGNEIDRDVVFLSARCVAHDVDDVAISNGVTLINHPWKNKKRLSEDYEDIKQTYELLLKRLSRSLNTIHDVKISNRGWEIIIGPWLRMFITCIFEHNMLIDEAVTKHNVDTLIVGERDGTDEVSIDTSEFIKKLDTSTWAECITIRIIEITKQKINVKYLPNKDTKVLVKMRKYNSVGYIKNKFKEILCKIDCLFMRKQKFVLHRIGFKWHKEIKFLLKQRGMPVHFFFPALKFSRKKSDLKLDRSNFKIISTEKKLDKIVSELLPDHLPKIFFEHFQDAIDTVDRFYPVSPIHIITGVGYYSDDMFKLFTALNVDKGARYSIMQHGGNFGLNSLNDEQDLILKTADAFITWGWKLIESNEFSKKIIPGSSLLLSNYEAVKFNPDGFILTPLSEWTFSTFKLYNSPQCFRQLDYLDDIGQLYHMLPDRIAKQFKLKLQPGSKRWFIKERFDKIGLGDKFLTKTSSFVQEMPNTRLCVIVNNNSTTILEALALNMPTIFVLNENYWPDEPANAAYEELEKVGILFRHCGLAAKKIIEVYDKIDDWWSVNEVQKARENFVSKYAQHNKMDVISLLVQQGMNTSSTDFFSEKSS
jgi:putative transferase (TIGR04331 family)